MRFIRFEIENFKGIAKAVLDLSKPPNANIFTLVGLNESGKTTLLEAINSFSPDEEGVETLYRDVIKKIRLQDLIPKNKKANFTGDIKVRAFVEVSQADKKRITNFCSTQLNSAIDLSSVSEIRVERVHTFADSRLTNTMNYWTIPVSLKKGKAKKFKTFGAVTPEWQSLIKFIGRDVMPKICYFPTFLFGFPERIYLSNPPPGYDTQVNAYFVQIVQDILDSLGEGLDIKKHIVDRVERTVTPDTPWNLFGFWKTDEKQQIDHVMLKIASQVTQVIFTRWNDIFGVKVQNKNIDVDWDVETDVSDEEKKRAVYLKFWIRDGQSKFDVAERSLGFRWFFCFLLFTQFRVSRQNSAAMFLFDEPASNLHSRAQEQLLKSFASISVGSNMTLYSTHSHYMIEPRWLEGAFIVFNDAVDYDGEPSAIASTNLPTNIHVRRYRDFVGQNPDKITYFQPILDKLDFAPSKLELSNDAIFVEGKNDFYMLSYFREIVFGSKYKFRIIPSSGANDLGPLISLYVGWGKNFFVLLDDDGAGKKACEKYRQEWFLADTKVSTIADLVPELKNRAIERILSPESLTQIAATMGKSTATKKDVARYFQEKYAQQELIQFDAATTGRLTKLLDECALRLS